MDTPTLNLYLQWASFLLNTLLVPLLIILWNLRIDLRGQCERIKAIEGRMDRVETICDRRHP